MTRTARLGTGHGIVYHDPAEMAEKTRSRRNFLIQHLAAHFPFFNFYLITRQLITEQLSHRATAMKTVTVGLIGYGSIGSICTRLGYRAIPFRMAGPQRACRLRVWPPPTRPAPPGPLAGIGCAYWTAD